MKTIKFKNRVKALSLFANVGIAETYLDELGVDVVVANELLEVRCNFYKHLYPNVNVIQGDITEEDIFNKVIQKAKESQIEMVIATPPCQGMSCAGRKDPKDPRNFLVYYAVEAIKLLKPRFVIIENVTMQQHTQILYKDKYVFIPEYIENELGEYYSFNKQRIVNAMDYGVPQSRQRYIYLLVRKDESVTWEFPKKNNHIITLKEAIGDLPSLDPCLRDVNERWRFPDYEFKRIEGLKVSKWHYPPVHSWKQVEWMIHTPSGMSAFKNKIFYPMTKGRRVKGAPRTYMRMDWDKPATTIMQNSGVISAFSTVHPGRIINDCDDENQRFYSDARALTIYELLILSSLPLDWNIPEWADDILIRKVIGEGIPPLLIKKAIESLIVGGKYDR
ncbi:DNA cytosine methyltransferase [Longibaculum muris]|uniref:DNA (cytosine-5-)-methyltransferase n=1 Tax=Longibaculum muris TaxID=1796628 RepID=A0A4V2W5Z5_9FIRM|nr:DNA cytosine methyltransferase [Longibaculum muris]MCR1886982.1 DNA cytosine methyltransferase [Longibaculum muris]TCW03012.1 DNA (cytosine-5)-methyltransferase 1 [Longibaculum muris]